MENVIKTYSIKQGRKRAGSQTQQKITASCPASSPKMEGGDVTKITI